MSRPFQMLKVGITNLFHWDFLIAILPMLLYGLWFLNYGGYTSYAYWKVCCLETKRGDFSGMIGSIGTEYPMLASCYCIYFVLKIRAILASPDCLKSKPLYLQVAAAIPSIFIVTTLIIVFCLPHEWSTVNWGW